MPLPALGALGGMQQIAERLAEHQVRRDAGHGRETLGQEPQPEIGIGLPDPVRAGVGDVAKAHLAGLDGLGGEARVAQDEHGEQRDHRDRDRERREDRAQELPAGLVRLPGQAPEPGAVGRDQRQHGGDRGRPGRRELRSVTGKGSATGSRNA